MNGVFGWLHVHPVLPPHPFPIPPPLDENAPWGDDDRSVGLGGGHEGQQRGSRSSPRHQLARHLALPLHAQSQSLYRIQLRHQVQKRRKCWL